MTLLKRLALAMALACMAPAAALAQTPPSSSETAIDPDLEAQAHAVGKTLRCVVCQNQSIEDSAAPLAADMRALVRERLAAGDSPDDVRAYMSSRYGNFVLLKPPFQMDTLFLWLGPPAFIILALVGWLAYLRPRMTPGFVTDEVPDLTPVEQARIQAILEQDKAN